MKCARGRVWPRFGSITLTAGDKLSCCSGSWPAYVPISQASTMLTEIPFTQNIWASPDLCEVATGKEQPLWPDSTEGQDKPRERNQLLCPRDQQTPLTSIWALHCSTGGSEPRCWPRSAWSQEMHGQRGTASGDGEYQLCEGAREQQRFAALWQPST